jgi:hypothetical protein
MPEITHKEAVVESNLQDQRCLGLETGWGCGAIVHGNTMATVESSNNPTLANEVPPSRPWLVNYPG